MVSTAFDSRRDARDVDGMLLYHDIIAERP
jgi:hypothetical protein